MHRFAIVFGVSVMASVLVFASQRGSAPKMDPAKFLTQPLITDVYTADPSAHVFNGKIYIYCSHDIDAGEAFDDLGSHFAMEDYHVLYMDHPDSDAEDHGVPLHVNDVPWASKQMWAPDANEKDGKYYLFFPA